MNQNDVFHMLNLNLTHICSFQTMYDKFRTIIGRKSTVMDIINPESSNSLDM